MNNKEKIFKSLNVVSEFSKMGFKELSLDEFIADESYEPRIVAFYNDNTYSINQGDFNKDQKTFNELKKKMSNVLMIKQNVGDDEFVITVEQNQSAINKYDEYKKINKSQNTSKSKINRSIKKVDIEKESDLTVHLNLNKKTNEGKPYLKNPEHLSKEIRVRRGLRK